MSGVPPATVRARLRAGEVLVGAFVNLGSSLTAEIMGIAGFDWLVLDREHGAGDEHLLVGELQALAGTATAALVRVEGIEPARVLHALDLGADGVLVPRVNSASEARECVAYCRYSGKRGVARYNRSWQWGLATRSLEDVDREIVCAVQIESAAALQAVDEIAAVEGVDTLFVGPADLAHSLGRPCPPDDPELLDRVVAVAEAAQRHGKAAGVLVGTLEQARRYRELGFTLLGCNSDSSLLASAASELAGSLRVIAAGSPQEDGAKIVGDGKGPS